MHLINIQKPTGQSAVIAKINNQYREIMGEISILEMAKKAISQKLNLDSYIGNCTIGEIINIEELIKNNGILPILNIDDPAHIHLTGTGLTHLGSAEGRDKMHKSNKSDQATLTDSMKMFLMGVENGKPKEGEIGAQPEWFYKGNGHNLVGAYDDLNAPSFALDGGEEPEIAGIYWISDEGEIYRLGFALANEFSDHIVEKQNYLWLAHSKLRVASIGFELITGDLPQNIIGSSSIKRGTEIIWQKPFLSGEINMSHTIANLEYHHFKYDIFRKSGDIHVHFFGTATASFADGIKAEAGDIFEIKADAFDFAIANKLKFKTEDKPIINKL